jgi:putative transposase
MNEPKVSDLDYINVLVAAPNVFSCTAAARVQPDIPRRAAHDALTRLLHRLAPDSTPLWQEAQQHVILHAGLLIVDDTTLDKPSAKQLELVHRHWSGTHHRVVQGSTLVTLRWRAGTDALPCDDRFYDTPVDGLTKHAHGRGLLATATQRGFRPRVVAFDGWSSSLEHLKTMRDYGWRWLTRLTGNRQVNPDGTGKRALQDADSVADGRVVHLQGYGLIRVFRIVTPDGDTGYWATNDVTLPPFEREQMAQQVWTIET